jgi:hypothetical protein
VDERLLTEGRLRRLEDPSQVSLSKRGANGTPGSRRVRRDPGLLADLLLSAGVAGERARRSGFFRA